MKFSISMPIVGCPQKSGKPHFFLRECIRSVQIQAHQDWELLIVTDGPMPMAVQMVKEINDKRIRLFEGEQRFQFGGHANRNATIKHATGDYLCFLDHDDALAPDALVRAAEYATRYPGRPLLFSVEMPTRWSMTPKMQFGWLAGSMLVSPRDLVGEFLPVDSYSADYNAVLATIENAKAKGIDPVLSLYQFNRSRPWFMGLLKEGGVTNYARCDHVGMHCLLKASGNGQPTA